MPRVKGERRLEILKALAQMLEQPKWGRITTAALAEKITADEADGRKQADKLLEMLLAFAEKNPGMVRVMTGDALVGEHERLQARMNQFYDRFEATLKQSLRAAADGDAAGRASVLLRYAIGCLHQYAKSGFSKKPTESHAAQRRYLAA
jgi:TetR/AcrR family transcriptional regulator